MFAVDRFDARESRPSFVVNLQEVVGVFFDPALVHVLEPVARLFLQPFDPFVNVFRKQALGQFAQVGVLVEIVLEAVILEQADVVFEVVRVAVQRREFESLYQQSPPRVAVAEVDRAVHRLQAASGEPVARRVEKQVGYPLVVDRFEKSAAAGRLVFRRFDQLAVVKGGDASDRAAPFVECDPADRFAVVQQFVGLRAEPVFDVAVQRADPVRFVAVKPFGQVEKFTRSPPRGDFFERIVSHRVVR